MPVYVVNEALNKVFRPHGLTRAKIGKMAGYKTNFSRKKTFTLFLNQFKIVQILRIVSVKSITFPLIKKDASTVNNYKGIFILDYIAKLFSCLIRLQE